MTRSTNMEHVEVLRELSAKWRKNAEEFGLSRSDGTGGALEDCADELDAAIASLSAPKSRDAESKLAEAGVFAGHHGLRGLADADEFWEKQPYGTRLYYGDGGMDYLHRGVLQKAVEILDAAPQPPARMASIPESSPNGWLQAGGLLYRLTEGHRPQNRDEINVTMVHGSRDPAHCEARAAEILAMLQSQPPAEAQEDEVVCLECGQPTMHMGQVCYACSHPAKPPAEAQARPAKPAECADGCPDQQVCDHCQWPPGPDAEAQAQGDGEVAATVVTKLGRGGEVGEPVVMLEPSYEAWLDTQPPSTSHKLYAAPPSAPDGAVHDALQRDIDARGFAEIRQAELDALTGGAPSAPVGVEGLVADLETIWHSVSDDKETNAAYRRLKAALAQQPAAAGEEIMVNAAHDVYTLPLQPSGLSSGPRFVVHVPGPEQPAAVDGVMVERALNARYNGYDVSCYIDEEADGRDLIRAALTAALAAQQGGEK